MPTEHAMRQRAAPAADRPAPAAGMAGLATAQLAAMGSALNATPRVQDLLAMRSALSGQAVQRATAQPNRTGLPDSLKAGIEAASGMSMDATRVHYNSAEPAQLNAHAFAQGTDIHLAPGQERHLPHEAWHVVQQAQGRVPPTTQVMQRVPVNDDPALEREADQMGLRAAYAGGTIQRVGSDDEDDEKEQEPGLLGALKRHITEQVPDYFGINGSFIWIDGATRQSLELSHIHIFAVTDERVTGQITVRNTGLQGGGPGFNTAEANGDLEDQVRAAVRDRVGGDEASRDTRTNLGDDLMQLWNDFKEQVDGFYRERGR